MAGKSGFIIVGLTEEHVAHCDWLDGMLLRIVFMTTTRRRQRAWHSEFSAAITGPAGEERSEVSRLLAESLRNIFDIRADGPPDAKEGDTGE